MAQFYDRVVILTNWMDLLNALDSLPTNATLVKQKHSTLQAGMYGPHTQMNAFDGDVIFPDARSCRIKNKKLLSVKQSEHANIPLTLTSLCQGVT